MQADLEENIYITFPVSLEDLPAHIAQCDVDNIIEFVKQITKYCEDKTYYSDFVKEMVRYFERENNK